MVLHQPLDAAGSALLGGTLGEVVPPIATSSRDGRVERGGVDRLEAEERRVVGRARLDEGADAVWSSSRQVDVAPDRRAGHQTDDVTEERVEGGRLRNLDAQVGEFEVDVHARDSTASR